MPQPNRRRQLAIFALILLLLLLGLLLVRCQAKKPASPPLSNESPAESATDATAPASPSPDTSQSSETPEEILGPASLQAPAEIGAGKRLSVAWTGPNNPRDYITIVRRDAANTRYGNYADTRLGSPLELLAPIETGEWELRYVTGQTKTVLARSPIVVTDNAVTLRAPDVVTAGTVVSVSWTGPNNEGDYLTFVPRTLPDGQYRNYTYTNQGSPLDLTAPIEPGDIELRYMTGQGAKVLQRFPLRVVAADITLAAPASVRAGESIAVTWTGPDNAGDYLTLVPATLPDGQYASYAYTRSGPTLTLAAPGSPGPAEIRYMSGQGAKVLKRHPIIVTP